MFRNWQKKKFFKEFVSILRELGCFVSYSVVNCMDYGVPQRNRLVLSHHEYGSIDLIPIT